MEPEHITLKGGDIMTKAELAKELTLAALNNKYISEGVLDKTSYISINEQIAENVAAFYNKLMEKLDITE
jgi:hypothetical protein